MYSRIPKRLAHEQALKIFVVQQAKWLRPTSLVLSTKLVLPLSPSIACFSEFITLFTFSYWHRENINQVIDRRASLDTY